MNRTSLYITLLIAFVLASAASVLVASKLNQSSQKAPTRNVIVAAKDLDVGSPLTAENLKVTSWTGGDLPQGVFANVADLSGRAVLYPMFADEVVLEQKLARTGAGAGLPAVIPEGMRAVSIRVDDVVAVAGFVGPGTKVDVLLTGNSGTQSVTRTILEDVQVLAAGEKIQPDAQGRAEKVNVVTLLCTAMDAAKVTLAASDGRIQLVLRNPMDKHTSTVLTQVVRGNLYGNEAPVRIIARAAPAKPAPAPPVVAVAPPPPPPPPPAPVRHTVILIRGDRTASIDVDETITANRIAKVQ